MAYSDFTLKTVQNQFELTLSEQSDLFRACLPLEPSLLLKEILAENIPLALGSNTEKARSELLITPILVEVRRQLKHQISFFSGVSFNVDPEQGLNGSCDFIITDSQELLVLQSPVITLVEAKKEDLNAGLGQCIAEMVAAQRFNQQEGKVVKTIYGIVTSGTVWKFLRLEKTTVFIDLSEYYLSQLAEILGIIAHSALSGNIRSNNPS